MALIDGLGGSKRWNRWLSVVDRVALSAWNTHSYDKSDRNNPNTLYKRHVDCQFDGMYINYYRKK